MIFASLSQYDNLGTHVVNIDCLGQKCNILYICVVLMHMKPHKLKVKTDMIQSGWTFTDAIASVQALVTGDCC